jgi:hypothetical protein
MAIDLYVTQTYPVECKGRDEYGNEVLESPLDVKVEIHTRPGSNTISSSVDDCPHNVGGHGQRCKASHPDVYKIEGHGVICHYSFDIPYAFDPKK